jgi:hypothetical protein
MRPALSVVLQRPGLRGQASSLLRLNTTLRAPLIKIKVHRSHPAFPDHPITSARLKVVIFPILSIMRLLTESPHNRMPTSDN